MTTKIKAMDLYELMATSTATKQYHKYTEECYNNAVEQLPVEYKHCSMDKGTKCDLSYNQGQRDAYLHIRNMLFNINIDIECLIDARSDKMHEECNREVD